VIALLLLLAASGTHTDTPRIATPARTKVLTACLAVTRMDVQFALGRSIGTGREESTAKESTCDYSGGHGQVTVTIQRLAQEADLAAEMAGLQREIEGSSMRPAPMAGERAFFLDIAGAGTQLHVIRGCEYLLISILGFGEAPAVSGAAERLALAAFGRM
jgi:hypothetical protein